LTLLFASDAVGGCPSIAVHAGEKAVFADSERVEVEDLAVAGEFACALIDFAYGSLVSIPMAGIHDLTNRETSIGRMRRYGIALQKST
jgi:hypothetical protein